MNMHLIQRILNLDWKTVQVMLFDKHPNGPFMDLINKAYCPKFGTIRHNHYSHKKVNNDNKFCYNAGFTASQSATLGPIQATDFSS